MTSLPESNGMNHDINKATAGGDQHGVAVNVPLIARLRKLDVEIGRKFPGGFEGLGDAGLAFMSELQRDDYWCTPRNSLGFGGTMGDASFSFIVTNNEVTDSSPIVMTVPSNSGLAEHANVILAKNFEHFVRLGLCLR